VRRRRASEKASGICTSCKMITAPMVKGAKLRQIRCPLSSTAS
jgi:hypothetical protein